MKIFLLSGKARSGKGSTAEHLKKIYGDRSIELLFAKSIKQYAIDYFGWNGEEATKPREFLQFVGTDIIRDKLNNPNFHVNRVIEDIDILKNYFDIFIISDCRFPNELELVKDKFGDAVVSIRVERFYTDLTCDQQRHKSELALDDYKDWDYVLQNDSTLEDFYSKIDNIVAKIKGDGK